MCSACGHREHRNNSLRPLRRGRLVVRPQQGKALVHVWGINHTGRVLTRYLKFPITGVYLELQRCRTTPTRIIESERPRERIWESNHSGVSAAQPCWASLCWAFTLYLPSRTFAQMNPPE